MKELYWLILAHGVHSGDRVDFKRVSFGLVVFWIGYFSDTCYDGSHLGRVV